MIRWIARYTNWLHTRWPAGTVEPFPRRARTAPPTSRCVHLGRPHGDPPPEIRARFGARVAAKAAEEVRRESPSEILDLAIVGAGVSGMAAAVEAKRQGLRLQVSRGGALLHDREFSEGEADLHLSPGHGARGELRVSAKVKEALVEELKRKRSARASCPPRRRRARRAKRLEPGVRLEGGGFLGAPPGARGASGGVLISGCSTFPARTWTR